MQPPKSRRLLGLAETSLTLQEKTRLLAASKTPGDHLSSRVEGNLLLYPKWRFQAASSVRAQFPKFRGPVREGGVHGLTSEPFSVPQSGRPFGFIGRCKRRVCAEYLAKPVSRETPTVIPVRAEQIRF